jgi:hypothetical protein
MKWGTNASIKNPLIYPVILFEGGYDSTGRMRFNNNPPASGFSNRVTKTFQS